MRPRADRQKATTLYFNEYFPIRQKQMGQVDELLKEVQRAAAEPPRRRSQSLESTKRIVFWFAGGGLVLCVVAGVWAWRTTASVMRQIEGSVDALTTGHAAGRVDGSAGGRVGAVAVAGIDPAGGVARGDVGLDGGDGVDDAPQRREQPRGGDARWPRPSGWSAMRTARSARWSPRWWPSRNRATRSRRSSRRSTRSRSRPISWR